jgi:Ca2+-binding RTX toxin-like protein
MPLLPAYSWAVRVSIPAPKKIIEENMPVEIDHPVLKAATDADVELLNTLIQTTATGPSSPTPSNSHDANYFVAFDGTLNNKDNPNLSPTNVEKILLLVRGSPALKDKREYYPGPGTQGNQINNKLDSWFGYSMDETAEKAYTELLRWAQTQFTTDPQTNVRLSGVSFSRGGGSHTAFLNLVQEGGIPDTSTAVFGEDPQTGTRIVVGYQKYWVQPSQVDLGSHVVFDRVVAGARFDASVTQLPANADLDILSITSRDENRYVFALDSLQQKHIPDLRVQEIQVPGVHSDVGGGYWDSGISNYTLQAAYQWLQASGTPMRPLSDLPSLLREGSPASPITFDLNPQPVIHDAFEGTFGYDGEERGSGAWVPGRANNTNHYASPIVLPKGAAGLSAALSILGVGELPPQAIAALDALQGLAGPMDLTQAQSAATQLLGQAGALKDLSLPNAQALNADMISNLAGQLLGQDLAAAKVWTDAQGLVNLKLGDTLLGISPDGSALKTLLDDSGGQQLLTRTVFANGGQLVQSATQAFSAAGIGGELIQKQFMADGGFAQLITQPSGAFSSGLFSADGFGTSADFDADGHAQRSETVYPDGSRSIYEATYANGALHTSSQVNKDAAGRITHSDILSADGLRKVQWASFDSTGHAQAHGEIQYNDQTDEVQFLEVGLDGSISTRRTDYFSAPSRQASEEHYLRKSSDGRVEVETLRRFDALGHLLYDKAVDSDGQYGISEFAYQGDARSTAQVQRFDAQHRLLTSQVDNADQSRTRQAFTYDADGQISTSSEQRYNTRGDEEYAHDLSADGSTHTRLTSYFDAPSRQIKETSSVGKDSAGQTVVATLQRFAPMGHLLYDKSTDSTGQYSISEFTYVGDTRQVSDIKRFDASGRILASEVNAADGSRVVQDWSYAATGLVLSQHAWHYNAQGQEFRMESQNSDGSKDSRDTLFDASGAMVATVTNTRSPQGVLTQANTRLESNVNHDDVRVTRQGDDLLIHINQAVGVARIPGFIQANTPFMAESEFITFGKDGQHWSPAQVVTMLLTGTQGSDVITGFTTADTLTGLGGNDTLDGGLGSDALIGGDGHDQYKVDAGDLVMESNGEIGGTDTIYTEIDQYLLPENVENLVMTGKGVQTAKPTAEGLVMTGKMDTRTASGNGQDNHITGSAGHDAIRGMGGDDTLLGMAGSDSLSGGERNDLLIGGTGLDTLIGGAGNDIYAWGLGDGADTLIDSAGQDQLRVLAGIDVDKIWLRQVASHLEVSVIGTSDRITIDNWYSQADKPIESIALTNGRTLSANGIQTLVDAMARFTPPATGQTSLPNEYQAQLGSLIAAQWR